MLGGMCVSSVCHRGGCESLRGHVCSGWVVMWGLSGGLLGHSGYVCACVSIGHVDCMGGVQSACVYGMESTHSVHVSAIVC